MRKEVTPLAEALRQAMCRSKTVQVGATCMVCIPFASGAARDPAPSATLNQVVIESTRVGLYDQKDSSISKLTEPLRDTPQSVSVMSEKEISDRGLNNLQDALRSVPGISLGAGETSFQGTNLYLRGFTTRNDVFLDGMRDFGYYYRDLFNSDSLEVLKGPASMIFGRGSTGGVIEQDSKKATLATVRSATVVLGTDETRRGMLDLGGAAPALGATAAYRLNAMAHSGDIAERDTVGGTRWGIAPSLALGLGTPTRLTASYFHQQDNLVPDYGLPWLAGRPVRVERNNFYGFDSDHIDTVVDIATVRVVHDFSAAATVRNQLRYSHSTRNFRTSEAVIPAGVTLATPLDTVSVTRNEFEGHSTDSFFQDQADVTLSFATGTLHHQLVTGVEFGRESAQPVYITNVGVPSTNLAHPQPQAYTYTSSYPRLAVRSGADTLGAYAMDTIKWGDWQAVLGARWDRFDSEYRSEGYSPSGQVIATTVHDEVVAQPSFRGALVYKPASAGSVYVSAGSSFNPSAEGIESLISAARSLSQANLNLDPEESRTYELGTKWELLSGRALFTTALFRTDKYNARVPDPAVPGFNSLSGQLRVSGLEMEMVGSLTGRWSLRAGYTFMDSEVVQSSPGGPVVGAALVVTPRHMGALWSQHQINPQLSVGVGLVAVSSRLAQNTAAATLVAPGYTVFEAMARYQLSHSLALQLNLSNLSNKYYFDQLHPFHVVPGPGRTALLSLEYGF